MVTALDRLTALREQPEAFTGIDFVRVVDPHDETVLRVYFLTDARDLVPALTANDPGNPDALTLDSVVIHNVTDPTRPNIEVTSLSDTVQLDADLQRTFIEVTVAQPGDFADYRLRIDDPRANPDPTQAPFSRIDPFFNDVKFSFKAGCPDGQDCLPATPVCPPDEQPDFPIDYLARDFVSFRNALLAYAAQRYPEWVDPTIVADVGVMLAEVMAALGDEFSYIQDRYAREAYLETATERRSLRKKARLLDFEIHDGVSAQGLLELTIDDSIADPDNPAGVVRAGQRVWATTEGGDPIAFEVGGGVRDTTEFDVHTEWNAGDVLPPGSLRPYVLDASQACLPVGATELFIIGPIPHPDEIQTQDPASLLLLRTEPTDPSVERRRHFVRVREIFELADPLVEDPVTHAAQVITRIRWDQEDALPFQIDQNDLQLSLNIVPVTAGETQCARFITGPDLVANPFIAVPDTVGFDCTDPNVDPPTPGTAVEREGPLFATPTPSLAADVTPDAQTAGRDVRPTIFLVGLSDTDTGGLGFLGKALRETTPEVVVHELDLATGEPTDQEWIWRRSLLSAGPNDPVFTLEDGIWRRIITFRHAGQDIVHQDYATGLGFSLRFGDGVFGRTPARGTAFEVRFRLGPGTRANVPAGAISAFTVPGHPVKTMPKFVVGARNPVEVNTGVDPETAAEIKQLVPEAYQAERFFAVQPDDYGEQAEKLDFVQRAQGTPRWTGSWLSMFVAADPFGAFALTPDQKAQLTAWMDCVRQTGREVIVKDPKPLSIDLEITVCIQPFAYASQVLALVQDALVGTGGGRDTRPFFSPDNFTFGMPLRRSALEATIQRIPGVRFVGPVLIRKRGVRGFAPMDALIEKVDADQVLQLANDPERPDAGTLRLIAEGGA